MMEDGTIPFIAGLLVPFLVVLIYGISATIKNYFEQHEEMWIAYKKINRIK